MHFGQLAPRISKKAHVLADKGKMRVASECDSLMDACCTRSVKSGWWSRAEWTLEDTGFVLNAYMGDDALEIEEEKQEWLVLFVWYSAKLFYAPYKLNIFNSDGDYVDSISWLGCNVVYLYFQQDGFQCADGVSVLQFQT